MAATHLLEFTLDEQRCALRVDAVEQVVRAVEVTPLPAAPEIVLGIINVRGRVVPVMDVRPRFGLPSRPAGTDDLMIVAITAKRRAALIVDSVAGVVEATEDSLVAGDEVLGDMKLVDGVLKTAAGMVFVYDLDRFLSLDEEDALDAAMASVDEAES